MRKCFSAFAVIIILLFASNVRGQALWHGTEYGMTLEQAKAHVPDAVRPLKPKQRSDGAEELLRLDNVTLVGKHFAASFFFSDGKLKEVSLSLEEGHDFEGAMRVFDSLVEDFRAKYGHEIIRQTMKGSFSNTANATWVSRQTTITLFATSVGENDATLNINYQVRASRRLMTRDLPSNSQVKAGKLGEIIQFILADLKPEAAYFTDEKGQRTGFICFEMRKASQIPAIAEPWFLAFNAGIELHPVMVLADLAQASGAIEQAVKKYA